MNNGCEFYADALVERAAGLLEEGRAGRVDAHLETCPECRDALRAVHALRAAPLAVPDGLEDRVRSAVRRAALPATGPATGPAADPAVAAARNPRRSGHTRWRQWALPLAAAAALVGIWIGVGTPGTGPANTVEADLAALGDYDPYGAWPAEGVIVAGDPLLSELSVEELETLLREMGS